MPNFSSLARLEVPEKFLWWGGVVVGWWGLQSHFHVKPNLVFRLGWGFENYIDWQFYNTCQRKRILDCVRNLSKNYVISRLGQNKQKGTKKMSECPNWHGQSAFLWVSIRAVDWHREVILKSQILKI